jgi:hypothetical protein
MRAPQFGQLSLLALANAVGETSSNVLVASKAARGSIPPLFHPLVKKV